MWQVELGGQWEKYDAPVGKALVEAKSRGSKEYRFEMNGQPMLVDFRKMTQTNMKTGKARPVRECVTKTPARAPAPSKPSAGPAKYPKLEKPTGGIYVHTPPTAPPAAPAAVAVLPATPEKTTPAKKA